MELGVCHFTMELNATTVTPRKLNSSPLEKGGTGTGRRSFPIRKAPFQGRTVKLRGGISIFMAASPKFFGPEMMDCRSLP